MRHEILTKTLILIALAMVAIGCGPESDYTTNNYYDSTYNVTELQIICAGMNEGDAYEIDHIYGSRVVIREGNCVLEVGVQ